VLVQQPQVRSGFDAELINENASGLTVRGQGICPAATAIQGGHQLVVERLPQRMLEDERVELRHQLAVVPQMQISFDPPLDCLQP
jgi:hypothetical protein